jgi:hypothetical protein
MNASGADEAAMTAHLRASDPAAARELFPAA